MTKKTTEYLEKWRDDFLKEIEDRFGNRNQTFKLGGIYYANWGPRAYAHNNIVNIALGNNVIKNDYLQDNIAKWQLAHETIHLLDPINDKNMANILEEGLATWYQNEKIKWIGLTDNKYIEAEKLFKRNLDALIPKILHLRKRGVSLKNITKQQLLESPNRLASEDDAEELTKKF